MKRKYIKPQINDIIKAFNNVGMELVLGKEKKDYIIAFDEEGNKHILGKGFDIFEDIKKPTE